MHTPGPWTIYDASNPHHIQIKGQHPKYGGSHVADVLFPENARLIAAAPDLLAALKLTEFGFNHSRCNVCGGFDGEGENDKVHSETCPVGAALAKAEGRPCPSAT